MPFDLSALLALKPRQVVLRANAAMKSAESTSLSSDQKALLFRSVALFLHSNGFSKTLKRFLSEADITKEALKSSEVLEEIYIKYLEICGDAKAISKAKVTSEVKKSEKEPKEADKDEDKKKKKKKKNSKKNNNSIAEEEPPIKDVELEEKASSDSIADETQEEEKVSKFKTKKNKKETSKDTEMNEYSKKRKRSVPDETQTKPLSDEKVEYEESKRRKVNGDDSEKKNEDCGENGMVINGSDQQINDAEKSGGRKSARKEINGSAEPKTVKAFQRVKVDEVEFTDERLKDNSYWAKSGAEIGYGAKAEEVLSQVRGRGFRHEKTKKKRGSYRGGQIDQGSHSIKFNYSDEE